VVRAGEAGRLVASSVFPVISVADTTVAFAWTWGGWAFRDTPLHEVTAELARRWNRHVVPDPAVASRRVTGVYRDERPEELLAILALATGTRVSAIADTIRFTPAETSSR
jgi:ferric-dicitrate binding protein FerR (iron transport regulator)